MKNAKMTIREKIAYLECIENLINHANGEKNWHCKYDNENNCYTDIPNGDDDYTMSHYDAWKNIIKMLEEMA